MRLKESMKLNFNDVLIEPKRSTLNSRRDVQLLREHKFLHSPHSYIGTSVVASNMDGVGTFSMAEVLHQYNMLTVISKHYTVDRWNLWLRRIKNAEEFEQNSILNHISLSTGTNYIHDRSAEDYKTLKIIDEQSANLVRFICIDVANAYNENVVGFVEKVRNDFPKKIIIVGNVCTPEMTQELLIKGADIVKVGIGPGSACTTRIMTGIGYPQLSAIIECADAAHGIGGKIIGDGGCTCPGDVVKAFGGGADFVMLGGMLAGHSESELEVDPKTSTLKFYGMSSDYAMELHGSRKDGYRSSEGRAMNIPYRGPVQLTVEEILGGIRSACTYIGARNLKDIPKCCTFVRTTEQYNRSMQDYF